MIVTFFFNDTATTEIYTLSLHDALPIWIFEFDLLWQRLAPKGYQRPKWSHQLERLFVDTKPCLQVLSKTYQLGIIANQAKGLKERLERLGISHYFALIVSSSDVGLQKPDLALFRDRKSTRLNSSHANI